MLIDRFLVLRSPELCVRRGYHGPFTGAARYDVHPEWRGMADCAICGSTCLVERQELMRELIEEINGASALTG